MTDDLKNVIDGLTKAFKDGLEATSKEVKELREKFDALDAEKENAELLAEIKARFDALKAPDKPAPKATDHAVEAPGIVTNTEAWKFDGHSIEDLSVAQMMLDQAYDPKQPRLCPEPASKGLRQNIVKRLDSDEGKKPEYKDARRAMYKSGVNLKANELEHSTQAGFGDEWIGAGQSGVLWNSIRHAVRLAQQIPSFAFPMGVESMILPLEGTDPTVYNVAEATGTGTLEPDSTITASKIGTARVTMNLATFGARTIWTGLMQENAVIAFAPQLRVQFALKFADAFESSIFDGDDNLSGSTNVNDIAGTPAATEYFTAYDGMRVSALVTTSANSRDGGTITTADFLETVKLMGPGGKNALDRSKVEFYVTTGVHYKTLELTDVKSRDVFSGATIESGQLTGIYGYKINTTTNLCAPDPNGEGLSNTDGKIDQDTAANNTKGTILAVRPDQWRIGYRKDITLETTRIARADAYELVGLMRAGLIQRDTEACAVSYNLTV